MSKKSDRDSIYINQKEPKSIGMFHVTAIKVKKIMPKQKLKNPKIPNVLCLEIFW